MRCRSPGWVGWRRAAVAAFSVVMLAMGLLANAPLSIASWGTPSDTALIEQDPALSRVPLEQQVTNAALAGIYCFALPVVLLVVGGALAAGVAGRSVAAAKSALVAEVREDLLATARAGLAAAATADFGAPFESKRSGGVVVTVTNGDRERAVRTAVMVAWTPDRVGRLSHATRFLAPGGGGGGAGSGGGHSAACTSLVTTALMSAIVARALAAGGSGSGPGAGDAERVVEGALEAAAGASDEALHGEAWACCEGRGHGRLASTRLWTGLWCLLLSLGLALLVTGVTKNWFGAPRPSFFYWNNFKGYAAVYGGGGGGAAPCSLDFLSGTLRSPLPGALRAYLAATNASALVPSAIAALYAPGTDACLDSLRAFPSGHASLSMACMGFAAAWTWALALRLTSMAVVHEHRHGAALVTGARAAAIAVCLLYVLLPLNVARTRVQDNWHSMTDVLAGLCVGAASALTALRYWAYEFAEIESVRGCTDARVPRFPYT